MSGVCSFPADRTREGVDPARERRAFDRHICRDGLDAPHHIHPDGVALYADLLVLTVSAATLPALFGAACLGALAVHGMTVLHAINLTREAHPWRQTRHREK